MCKSIIKIVLVILFAISFAFADERFSAFSQQEDINAVEPMGKDDYLAEKAPMLSKSTGYFGLSFGGGLTELKPEILMKRDDMLLGEIGDKKRSAMHYNVNFFTGYGFNLRNFYIGGELSAAYNSLKKSVKGSFSDEINLPLISGGEGCPVIYPLAISHNLDMTLQQPIVAAFDIIPGYLTYARDFLFYGRVGVSAGWLKLKLTDSFDNMSSKSNKIKFGYRVGFGMEYFISDSFGLKIEYIYSRTKGKSEYKFAKEEIVTVEWEGEEPPPPCVYAAANNYEYSYDTGSVGIHTVNIGFSIHY